MARRASDKDYVIDQDLGIYFRITDELRTALRKMTVKELTVLYAALRDAAKEELLTRKNEGD